MVSERITIIATDLLTPKQAAKYLGVTPMSIYRWRRDGKLTAVMLDHAYFHINELDRFQALREGG